MKQVDSNIYIARGGVGSGQSVYRPIPAAVFNGGERHVNLVGSVPGGSTVQLVAFLHTSPAFFDLALVVDALRRCYDICSIEVTIPYFPYARQDRVCAFGEALSVKVMADLINSLCLSKVHIFNPHSDVTPALLNSVNVWEMSDLLEGVPLDQYSALVSPDAGAEKKVHKANSLNQEIIHAYKTRNPKTGQITSTTISDCPDWDEPKDFLILDDICDGGRTFIELAKALKAKGPCNVDLYVTHGIFSQGVGALHSAIRRVYYNNTLNQESSGMPHKLLHSVAI